MKKLIAAFLCLAILCIPAFAEEEAKTGAAAVAKEFTYFHYAAIYIGGQYEFGENYPLVELEGHGYGDYEAYSTESRLFDVVFVPDETGEGIIEIHILGWAANCAGVGDDFTYANHALYNHVIALLFPFSLEGYNNDPEGVFGDSLLKELATASIQGMNSSYYSDLINFGSTANVQIYVNNGTYAAAIIFDEPVTEEILAERSWMLAGALE